MSEEISQGAPDDDGRPQALRTAGVGPRRLATVAGVLVAAAVVGWQVVSIVGQPARPEPPRPHSLGPVQSRPGIVIDRVCTSYTGSGTVEVSFRLVNNTGERVQILDVTPELPLGMLQPDSSTIGPGTCGPPGAATGDTDLQPGESTPVTFQLAPLVPCPQPAPVQAAVRAVQGEIEIDRTVHVLSDLGQLRVAGC